MTWIFVLILCDELMIWLHSLLQLLLLWTWLSLFCLDFLCNLLGRFCCDKLWLSETAMVCESWSNMIIDKCPVLRLFDRLGPLLSLNDGLRFLWGCFYELGRSSTHQHLLLLFHVQTILIQTRWWLIYLFAISPIHCSNNIWDCFLPVWCIVLSLILGLSSWANECNLLLRNTNLSLSFQ